MRISSGLNGLATRVCGFAVASIAICAAGISSANAQQKSTPVTLTEDANNYVLSNGIIAATVEKKSGDLISLKYKGTEMTAQLPGPVQGREYAYWSHDAKGPNSTARITIDPKSNNGERAEVEVKSVSGGQPIGDGPGGTIVADIDIHFAVERGTSGVYTYMQMEHQPDYPPAVLGEARFAVKTADFFDWMSVGPKWDKLYPKAEGAAAHEDKYDFTADQFENPAFGWSSTTKNVGFWFINPSVEYLSGGPTKVEFLSHRDTNAVQAPTILNYWRSSHYGGAVADAPQGEHWAKVVGPFLLYINEGTGHEAMYADAKARAKTEAARWPFDWVNTVDYPHKAQRATVTGKLILKDPQAKSTKLPNLRVGLTAPAYDIHPTARDGSGSATASTSAPLAPVPARTIDWQTDAKHYEFWTDASADGTFKIANVRPGTYTLHAFADGVLGEYARTEIVVSPGKPLELGSLDWTPVRHGKQIWEIGIPNRTGEEFAGGNNYSHDGTFLTYATLYPTDVHYTIGKSDFTKDWYFEQVPHNEDSTAKPAAYNMRTPTGRATPWTVDFNMPQASTGKAHLRLGLASTTTHQIEIEVNGQPLPPVDHLFIDNSIGRNGIHGVWSERDVVFDASMLKPGANTIKLTVPAGTLTSGVIYDYLRLEVE